MMCFCSVVPPVVHGSYRPTRSGFAAVLAAVLSAAGLGHPTLAASWHAGVDGACAASAASGRPVFAVVSARWAGQDAAALEQVLASPEADAVIAACFEPVRVDADAETDFVRRAGITHVPSGCILTAAGAVRTVFDMPLSTVEFVALVARLAQQNAKPTDPGSVTAGRVGSTIGGATGAVAVGPAMNGAVRVFEETSPFAGTGLVESVPTPQGSISVVSAKLRRLSTFARSEADQPVPVQPVTTPSVSDHTVPFAHTSPAANTIDGTASIASAEEPHLSSAPTGWPAERAGPLSPSPEKPSTRGTLEPAGSAAHSPPVAAAPWLDPSRQTSQSVDPWGRPVDVPAVAATAPATGRSAAVAGTSTAQAPPAGPTPAAQASAPAAPPEPTKPASFLATLQKPFTWLKRSSPSATEVPTMPPARPQPAPDSGSPDDRTAAVATSDAAGVPDPHGSMPLGLEGYCPVTLVDHGTWAEGRVQWGVRHRGRTYLFAGAEQQQTFLANPDRYAPALSGDDPVLAMESGTSTPGQRRYGVTYQSRMYLFATPENRATFAANPARYSSAVLVAERGRQVAEGTRRY